MQWPMHKSRTLFVTLLMILTFIAPVTYAASEFREVEKEIETITVLSENGLAVPLSQISSMFARGRTISVATNFGDSAIQKKKIEDGESADIFITSQPELVKQLQSKGLIDIYSIGKIAAEHDKTYTVAVVAGENMTPARVFLDFLKSYEAQELFKKNGFTIP